SRRDTEGAAAHIGSVEVELEYLFLRQVHLQPDGEEGLLDLALHGPLGAQEQVLCQLLGNARPALDHRVRTYVLGHGAHQSDEIYPPVLEEAAVFGRQHRLDDMVRHLVDRHRVPLDYSTLADLVAM